jgi:two-component sensor histidine kinase/ABC-type uncharacterized transport system substrate-binding protein
MIIIIPQNNTEIPKKTILILHGDAQFSTAEKTMDRTFDDVFSKAKTFSAVIYSENLEIVRFNSALQNKMNVEILKRRYSGLKLDLIMATDIFALRFLLSQGNDIFHNTPVVFCGISEGSIDVKKLPANMTGNYKGISIKDSVENIVKIHPSIKEIVFIVGTDQQDEDYKNLVLKYKDEYKGTVKLTIMQDFSLEDIKKNISGMLPKTAAVYLAIHQDKTGTRYNPQEVLSQILKNANIPVYGVADITLGLGVVGGNLFGFKDLSYNSAMIAMEVLNGKHPGEISVKPSKNLNYFDWNMLRKWKINIRNLPGGSIIVNEPPNPLKLYQTEIFLAVIFFIISIFLIIALIIQLRLKQKTENKLYRMNRELFTISECNQAMLHAENEKDLFSKICKIICEKGGYLMAWVGYAEQDENKSVRPVSWGGYEDGYLTNIDIRWSDTEQGNGPTGTCIRTKKSCYIQDYAVNQKVALWKNEAAKRGYRSSIALALMDVNKNVFGAMTIYASKPNAFDHDEIRLLEELSGDLSYGVNFLRYQTEQKKSEEKIRRSLAEKEALLRELYHRTKNNMQVISSMLNLQLTYTPDEKIKNVFNSMKNRIKSLSLVQEKLYLSNDLSSIDLKDYIIDLTNLLADSYNITKDKIELDYTGLESIFVLIDNAIPCGMVLTELISNSMKYAFPGKMNGKIKITLHKDLNGFIEIAVSDNGVGVSPGFDFKNDSKLGLKTMIFIVEDQLNGKMTISQKNGLHVSISFMDNLYERRV